VKLGVALKNLAKPPLGHLFCVEIRGFLRINQPKQTEKSA